MAVGTSSTVDDAGSPHVAEYPTCMFGGSASDCTSPTMIITGSIGMVQDETAMVPEPPLSASIPGSESPPINAPLLPAPVVDERPADQAVVEEPPAIAMNDTEPAPQEAPAMQPQPPAVDAPTAIPPSEPTAPACHELADIARSITIRFGFASASLDQSAIAWLETFTARLRPCPGARVTIEAHTDSDGHADRNKALSQRRADAVRRILIEGGAKPEQVSAVGFGHFRPNAPNNSAESKSLNRRAVMVVETSR